MKKYTGHSYNELILCEDESHILIQSTTVDSSGQITIQIHEEQISLPVTKE